MPNLQCTSELGEEFTDMRLPTLDTKLWVENTGKVEYMFYEKPMSSRYLICKDSALPENVKMASLSQNLIRRLKHTSQNLPISFHLEAINNFSKKMRTSGYTVAQTRRVVTAGLRGFETALKRAQEEGKSIHKGAKEGAPARYRKKLLAKTTWFKEDNNSDMEEDARRGSNEYLFTPHKPKTNHQHNPITGSRIKSHKMHPNPTTCVLFVEMTNRGEYARRLRAAEPALAEHTGYRVKVVERGEYHPCTVTSKI